ncbi:MAG TPA: lipocalin-like domain-containing protein [Amaricoccus sp.]|jgi:hypothetical protein|uniref:lipocalin-like domain-containing protein n=1 Tax=Amaricoccus sp. TaxID=1872485 RepID=UPI002B7EC12D|nr:lipocalin-like domain-containing protein [Amaricoccus sp.]HMQ94525.1 lipocalin-like domain-containing protein [Amaricoccus sp.]HMR54699.1 lipocalin-like domain-containing protein [Amaricoccus sp.]HMU01537.1 lipocalin-like domain-containing protein [Amaricoccus sp.]
MTFFRTAAITAGIGLAAPAFAQDQLSPAEQIVGFWQLRTPQGVVVTEDEFTSQIIFSDNGLMAVQAMSPDPEGESAYMRAGYEAYYGTYEVDEAAGTVTFAVESAIARDLIGQELERNLVVSENELTLTPTNPEETWSVTYERRQE